MQRCLQLATQGLGRVSPNPLVGCVIVHNDEIIGEGSHREFGGPHAEVLAIESVSDKSLLKESVLYVNLEPCVHHGKTPPCTELIVSSRIPQVVIGTSDPNPQVAGKGVEYLKKHDIAVTLGALEAEAKELNKRFITFHGEKRPYVILKWAQTADGFIDHKREVGDGKPALQITGPTASQLVHKWRSEEQAILIGAHTALLDDPTLTVRHAEGNNPIRVILQGQEPLPETLQVFNADSDTVVIKQKHIYQVLEELHGKGIGSVLVEGGVHVLNSFIEATLWDEARVFTGKMEIGNGVPSPTLTQTPSASEAIGEDHLDTYIRE